MAKNASRTATGVATPPARSRSPGCEGSTESGDGPSEVSTAIGRSILGLLERRGPTPIGELIAAVDGHPIEVEAKCDDLCRSGRIRTASCGVYALAGERRR